MAIKKKTSGKAVVAKSKKGSGAKKSKKTLHVKKKITAKKAIVLKKTGVKKQTPIKKVVVKKLTTKAKPIVKNKKVSIKKSAPKKAVKKSLSKKPIKKPVKKAVAKSVKPTKQELKTKVEKKTTVEKKTPAQVAVNVEKTLKVGVKTRKQLVAEPPQPVIEVSNHPKTKVKTILISQPKPENDKNPYYDLSKKYNLIETFRQFIKIEGLPVKDFRNQRVDILEHKAVILTSRLAVDHYFRMCNEMRVTVPESMKYFCINEATAYYLQKYIQYRKRKIFFGHQTIRDLVDVIRKNKEEKFLLPAADVHKEQICDFLDAIGIKYTKAIMYRTVSANLSDIKNLNDFDMLVFFTSAGINSLKQNFPNFKQGNTRIACFGAATANELKKHGYRLDVYAPNPKNPSMSGAIDEYIKEANKR
jgi:uroporphyrinogen-III synthase